MKKSIFITGVLLISSHLHAMNSSREQLELDRIQQAREKGMSMLDFMKTTDLLYRDIHTLLALREKELVLTVLLRNNLKDGNEFFWEDSRLTTECLKEKIQERLALVYSERSIETDFIGIETIREHVQFVEKVSMETSITKARIAALKDALKSFHRHKKHPHVERSKN